jgi:hypothetical protein
MAVGQAVLYRLQRYEIRRIVDGLVVIGRETDPVEVCIPEVAAATLLTPFSE